MSEVIAGKYEILRELGQGGMAEVFLARQRGAARFEKLVVIKRILPNIAQDTEFVTRFLDEARTAADLRHANVITIFEIGEEDGSQFIVMEYVHGHDLRRVLRQCAKKKLALPIQFVAQVGIEAAAGLHHAHTKTTLDGMPLDVVHRDVSPQNILCSFDGAVKIVDFGIAKAATKDFVTRTGLVVGKYAYMSPEQVLGEEIDARTDQFALGVVLWELLTMRRLFKRKNTHQTMMAVAQPNVPAPSQLTPDIPHELDRIVLKALATHADERYPTCLHLVEDLEDFLAENKLPHSPSRFGRFLREIYAEELKAEQQVGVGLVESSSVSASVANEEVIRASQEGAAIHDEATLINDPRKR